MTTLYDATTEVIPFGLPLGRHASDDTMPDTEPIPFPPDPPQQIEITPTMLKVNEECGTCGGSLALEWSGKTDTLRVLRDWRETHRCRPAPPEEPDAAGNKGALIERAPETAPGFAP